MAQIKVKVTRTDGRVALWERHPDHPEGEVFLATKDQIAIVALTAGVMDAIRAGNLEEVRELPAPEPAPKASKAAAS